MYIAVASNGTVMEIVTNERSSLDGMKAYAKMNYKGLVRFVTTSEAFTRFSNGEELTVDIAPGDNGRNFKRVVAA